MANHRSALKAVRSNRRKTLVNKGRRSLMRTLIKKVFVMVDSVTARAQKKTSAKTSAKNAAPAASKESIEKAFRLAQANLMRNASKGLLHKKTAARRVARLARSIKTV
ncbi:MAG: 30S ribosomal protein S20 [Holosporaceae bacterium]